MYLDLDLVGADGGNSSLSSVEFVVASFFDFLGLLLESKVAAFPFLFLVNSKVMKPLVNLKK